VIGSALGIHGWNQNGRPVGLTTNFESVRSALDAVTTTVGDTSLRDALFLALQTAAPEVTRPLLLIFTVVADASSLLLADQVTESERHANLRFHGRFYWLKRMASRLGRVSQLGERSWLALPVKSWLARPARGSCLQDAREELIAR